MTNIHVVEGAKGYGWLSTPNLKFVCDFERFTTTTTAKGYPFPLTNEYHFHPHYDLALVYLDQDHIGTNVPPAPLALSGNAPDPLIGFTIGVLGHPSFNSNLDPFPMYFGFGQDFGIKRFSPGYIRAVEHREWQHQSVEIFLHDATTLSGSSGSCILNLSDMKVIGLHFGGWPKNEQLVHTGGQNFLAQLFEANGAVPLWTLKDDPLIGKLYP